jgi:hypothetical protein
MGHKSITMKALLRVLIASAAFTTTIAWAADPLPSWNDGKTKQSIVAFVEKVTKEGSPDFVPVPERIATFDNDGTLWAEQPMYFQFQFALDRVKALAPHHPEWKDKEPFNQLIAGDMKAFMAGGEKSLMTVMAVAHSGITTEEFEKIVKDWLATAKHPKPGGLTSGWFTSPCWKCSVTCGRMVSGPSSCPAVAWSSCASLRRRPTVCHPIRSSAARANSNMSSAMVSPCS